MKIFREMEEEKGAELEFCKLAIIFYVSNRIQEEKRVRGFKKKRGVLASSI